MSAARCPDCLGETMLIGGTAIIVHAFSCEQRQAGERARCDYSDCRLPLPHDKVVKDGKKTCDEICRAKAWKERVGYGRLDQTVLPSAPVRTAPRKPSGFQVAYRKAVEGTTEALVEVGVERDEAELLAEKHQRRKLPAKQLARLEAMERPEPAPPPPAPFPVPEPEPDELPPAAEDEPHVHIYQRQRDDRDAMVWVEIDRVETRAAPGVALTAWLNEQYPEPLTGGYRAEGNGGSAETTWSAEAA